MSEKESWRSEITRIRNYSQEQFDKLIVYLNSGALVLTVGFFRDVIHIDYFTNYTLVVCSWISFALSLIIILLSHKFSIISMDCELQDKETCSDNWDKVVNVINWLSFLLLINGISLFLIFVKNNII